MTLITYPLRVHIADGVLEEALRAELEERGHRAPLLLADATLADSAVSERILGALPFRTRPRVVLFPQGMDKYAAADLVSEAAADTPPDVLVAYGSARAIAYGRKCRHRLGELGASGAPELFAVPGVDGLPNPCRVQDDLSHALFDPLSKAGLPSVLICDPTVMVEATDTESASALVEALARCLEAYLSEAYNPPADGIALEGIERSLRTLRRDGSDTMARRDLMAAILNAMLAQQKGIGPSQIIAEALRDAVGSMLDLGAITRLILPRILRTQHPDPEKQDALRRILSLPKTVDLADGVAELLAPLPLSARLSDLGVERDALETASAAICARIGLRDQVARAEMRAMLDAVY